jgi:hypothetical protein
MPDDPGSELRPYGPGGSLICARCVTASPEADEAAHRAFKALLDANAAISPTGAVLLTPDGPVPFDPTIVKDPDA